MEDECWAIKFQSDYDNLKHQLFGSKRLGQKTYVQHHNT